jgi:hypothetical protein
MAQPTTEDRSSSIISKKASAALRGLQGNALDYKLPNGAKREESNHYQSKEIL